MDCLGLDPSTGWRPRAFGLQVLQLPAGTLYRWGAEIMRHTVINTDIHNSINTVIYIFYTVITCIHICIICTFIYIYICYLHTMQPHFVEFELQLHHVFVWGYSWKAALVHSMLSGVNQDPSMRFKLLRTTIFLVRSVQSSQRTRYTMIIADVSILRRINCNLRASWRRMMLWSQSSRKHSSEECTTYMKTSFRPWKSCLALLAVLVYLEQWC